MFVGYNTIGVSRNSYCLINTSTYSILVVIHQASMIVCYWSLVSSTITVHDICKLLTSNSAVRALMCISSYWSLYSPSYIGTDGAHTQDTEAHPGAVSTCNYLFIIWGQAYLFGHPLSHELDSLRRLRQVMAVGLSTVENVSHFACH